MGPGDAHRIRSWANQGLWKVSRSTFRSCSTSKIMNLIHPKIWSQYMIPKYRPKISSQNIVPKYRSRRRWKGLLSLLTSYISEHCILNKIQNLKIEIHFMINKTTLQAQNTTYSIWQLMHGNFIIWGWQINWRKNLIWPKTFLNKWMLNWVLLWEDSRLKVKNFVQHFILPLFFLAQH